MPKQHDENQDVRILSRKMYVNSGTRTIKAAKGTVIGNRSWGRIDFLCHYKNYHFIWDNGVVADKTSYDDSDKKKNLQNAKKDTKRITKKFRKND